MPEWDDKDIIKGVKTPGKEELAFNQLVKKYQERMYWHIRKIVIGHDDADDVLQNTMIKVWRSLSEASPSLTHIDLMDCAACF